MGEFIKECLVDTVALICPEIKEAVGNMLLSRQTVTRRINLIAGKLQHQVQNKAANFEHFSLALDESCNVRNTAQLLISVRGITKDFYITKELAEVESLKGTTTGSDLFTEVNACSDKLGLTLDKLALVTINGCPNLTGKSVGFLKWLKLTPNKNWYFCIILYNQICYIIQN